jgi:murein L,D-transpeptidase YafK
MIAGCAKAPRLDPAPGERLADHVVVVKSAHTLTLYSRAQDLKSYKVALGRGPAGPKDHQGDHKTPEGEYILDEKNAHSRFHLALHVSYPNAADRLRAQKEGRDPGGAIMVHGVARGFGWLGSLQHEIDWTDGCIAVSNAEIEEIWRLVPVGTPIEIKP